MPLIICPAGAVKARNLANSISNLDFDPVLELKGDQFIKLNMTPDPNNLASLISDLAQRTYTNVKGNDADAPRPYGPLGIGDTVAQIVMYSNTPANTLPVIQHTSNSWKPLFPRSARIR